MKKSDLYREWARVLDMCEGSRVDPRMCWSYGEIVSTQHTPSFCEYPLEKYKFAVAILEDKPVFVGDVVYYKSGSQHVVAGAANFALVDWSEYFWNPPKKSFLLNGVELPCPIKNAERTYGFTLVDRRVHFFATKECCNNVLDAIDRILLENTI